MGTVIEFLSSSWPGVVAGAAAVLLVNKFILSSKNREKTQNVVPRLDYDKLREEKHQLDLKNNGLQIKFDELQKKTNDTQHHLDEESKKLLELQRKSESAQEHIANLRQEKATLKAKNQSLENNIKILEKTDQQLEERSNKFVNAAKEQLKNEARESFTTETDAFNKNTLSPLQKDLTEFKKLVNTKFENENSERSTLKGQIAELINQSKSIENTAEALAQALRGDSKTQGDWGEMVLESILDASGLEKDRDYFVQASSKGDQGQNLRPDVVVKLPPQVLDGPDSKREEKYVIIDSKVSLTAYAKYVDFQNARPQSGVLTASLPSDPSREQDADLYEQHNNSVTNQSSHTASAQIDKQEDGLLDSKNDPQNLLLKQHINSIKKHIKDLSEKKYEDLHQGKSPDFVFMFVPIDMAFLLACRKDLGGEPDLVAQAFKKYRVAVVTPSTLLSSLRIVHHMWSVDEQNKSARKIAERGALLYDKFVGFVDNLIKVGESLDKSQKSYNDAFSQLKTGRGNLVSQCEDLIKLGRLNPKKKLSEKILATAELNEQSPPQLDTSS